MGNEELAQTILAGFVEDLPRRIEALREMLQRGNAKDATMQAHTIKGATATVGGEAVRALAAALEESGRKGDLQGMRSRLAEIEAGAAELLLAIGRGLG